METSDHCPLLTSFSTATPKSQIFRFENFMLQQPGFLDFLLQEWSPLHPTIDPAKIITSKFKNLRKATKARNVNIFTLKTNISNVKHVIEFLEFLEDFRDLSLEEWNFREILRNILLFLLEQQRIYWRQRGALKWVKLGDEGTKIFHANATIKNRNNFISRLVSGSGEFSLLMLTKKFCSGKPLDPNWECQNLVI